MTLLLCWLKLPSVALCSIRVVFVLVFAAFVLQWLGYIVGESLSGVVLRYSCVGLSCRVLPCVVVLADCFVGGPVTLLLCGFELLSVALCCLVFELLCPASVLHRRIL